MHGVPAFERRVLGVMRDAAALEPCDSRVVHDDVERASLSEYLRRHALPIGFLAHVEA